MASAEVKVYNGVPTLFINGKPTPILVFEGPHEYVCNYAEKKTGIHLYSFITPLGWVGPDSYDYAEVDRLVRDLIARDSKGYILPQVDCNSPEWWDDLHPDELTIYDDGKVDVNARASWASELWREDTGQALARYIKHVRESDYSDHVIGFYICVGYTGEWNRIKAQNGFSWDYSEPMKCAFRDWLRKKYGDDVKSLQKSWKDAEVDFFTAEVPTRQEEERTDFYSFRDPSSSRKVIDYYLFRADLVADDVIHFCKIAKESDREKSIVGVSYGYVVDEFPGAMFSDEGFTDFQRGAVQNWSHHRLTKVIGSSYLDFICGFYPDFNRQAGGDAAPFSVLETVKLHGKLYIVEDDTRTCLSTNDKLGKSETIEESISVARRHFSQELIRGLGTVWANQGPGTWWPTSDVEWYDHPDLLRTISEMGEIARRSMQVDRSFAGELAVLIDEDSPCYEETRINLRYPLLYLQKEYELGRIGTPYGIYLHSDLDHPDMPDYRLYVFLNTFHLSQEERDLIKRKVQRNGNVIVWVYASGLLDDETISASHIEELTGIHLAIDRDQWGLNITITDYEHPITANLPVYMRFGTDHQIGPIVYSDDPQARTLGRLIYSRGMSRPGFCVKEFQDWTSIFIGAPVVPAAILRNIAKYAGIHLYSESLDALYANNSFLAIHTHHVSGPRTIKLPKRCDVYDVFAKKLVARNVVSFVDNIPARTTKLYYIGQDPIDF